MKLKELKSYLETLTDEQLEQEAIIMGDQDEGFNGGPLEIETATEDWYSSEDGAFPKSALSDEDWNEYIENGGGKVAWEKGKVHFWVRSYFISSLSKQ